MNVAPISSFIHENSDGVHIAICSACSMEAPAKLSRNRAGNIQVAYLPDGWRFADDLETTLCPNCGSDNRGV